MLKSIKACILSTLVLLMPFSFCSCDDFYEDEGDCVTKYRIKFVYDKNLKWADAFPSEVKSVNLYIFDSNGKFVKGLAVAGEKLSQPGFCIEFDEESIAPGDYTFVAWCGLVNNGVAMQSFTVPQPVVGVTTIEELTCTLNTLSNQQYSAYSDTMLNFLYHGMLKANLPSNDGLVYEYTIYLTKDTNHIRIILQELSGDDMNADDYSMQIVAADGRLAYNNDLLPDNPVVTYLPWAQHTDRMELGDEDGTIQYNQGLVADFTTSRMMATQQNDFMLTIANKESKEQIIAKVPVIQYALLAKDYYTMAYDHNMTDQEFLDREDEYVLTFFMYQNKWIDSYIEINSWRIVLHDYELGN